MCLAGSACSSKESFTFIFVIQEPRDLWKVTFQVVLFKIYVLKMRAVSISYTVVNIKRDNVFKMLIEIIH